MLEVTGLAKKYKNSKVFSIKNITFSIRKGEIFGFLGKNGAGKTTTIKCITGLLPFSEGNIKVCGHDLVKEPLAAKTSIGYVPDNHAVYDNLTGREYISFIGNLYEISAKTIKEKIVKFSNLFSMGNVLDSQIRSYSHGMKQKVCIIGALIHDPKLWVLDEPLLGLDPQSAFEIKQYMKKHKEEGNSVFFSSHSIEIIEKICDRVAIMKNGQIIEVIDIKNFLSTSSISLEEYFLNKTADEGAVN